MKLIGMIIDVVFQNDTNGYKVITFTDHEEEWIGTGVLPYVVEGVQYEFEGEFITHPLYGEQFRIDAYVRKMPDTLDKIEDYLSSGLIEGIGPSLAHRIVAKFAHESLDILRYHPERLLEVNGIGPQKMQVILNSYLEHIEAEEVLMYLTQLQITPSVAMKIYAAYREDTIEKVRENPYRLARDIDGIGFKLADAIAEKLGIQKNAQYRVMAAVVYVLELESFQGHTFVLESQLKRLLSQWIDIDEELYEATIYNLLVEQQITVSNEDERRIYLLTLYEAELDICTELLRLLDAPFEGSAYEGVHIDENFTVQQREAIAMALQNKVTMITGGPGTGKTTIVKELIRLFTSSRYKVVLAAPTGRAASRMEEVTGVEAMTIHRLLEYTYQEDKGFLTFNRHHKNPIEADILILDECSMIDILLFKALLKAVKTPCRVVLIGDSDQLPSVGPGLLFRDLLSANVIKSYRLTEIHRQVEGSLIMQNAHSLLKQGQLIFNHADGDCFHMDRQSPNRVLETIKDLIQTRLPNKYPVDPRRDITVLTPAKSGFLGAQHINKILQEMYHESGDGFRGFFQKDRVMQIKNNYQLKWVKNATEGEGVFNGEMGEVVRIEAPKGKVVVRFDDDKLVEYYGENLDELSLGYAMTVHKSQGNEFPIVIMPLIAYPRPLMNKNILYTAMTRAKQLLVFVGSAHFIDEMKVNNPTHMRNTSLKERLEQTFEVLT
jgi:exodeoxyribonuclease V alpha subunit